LLVGAKSAGVPVIILSKHVSVQILDFSNRSLAAVYSPVAVGSRGPRSFMTGDVSPATGRSPVNF